MFDLGNAQESRNHGQGLIDTGNRLIGGRPQLLRRRSALATALEA